MVYYGMLVNGLLIEDGYLEKALNTCDKVRLIPWRPTWSCSSSLIGVSSLLAALTLLYILYTTRVYRKRKVLEEKLVVALKTVADLEDLLMSLETQNDTGSGSRKDGKEIRIWMDGAFDVMHFGHMNAFRQARALGTYLIAGINSSETITAAKGAPVNDDDERTATVAGCKWVDEVVGGVPYVMNEEYVRWIIEHYKIDYIVHGDDPCIVDGKDVYESAKKMGKYLTIPRTEGISTTDIVGRMLLLTKDHHSSPSLSNLAAVDAGDSQAPTSASPKSSSSSASSSTTAAGSGSAPIGKLASSESSSVVTMPYLRKSNFLATSRFLRLFGAGVKAPKRSDRVVYLAGGWDMFHAGHIATLEKARELGDYLIVGVHNDHEVNKRRGLNYPIMSLHERVLSVLGGKWVDDVLIDAPYAVTAEMVASLRISTVVIGTAHDSSPSSDPCDCHASLESDPYAVPRSLGILRVVQSTRENLCTRDIVGRIALQKEHFNRKFEKKKEAEDKYYDERYSKHLGGLVV